MDLKLLSSAIVQLAEEREIVPEQIVRVIEMAIAGAYKKEYGKKEQVIKCKLDLKTGEVKFWKVLEVIDESMVYFEKESENKGDEKKNKFNVERHIMIEDAKKINPDVKIGEELEIPLEVHENYGRIAAQTAKQIILQRIKEVERETILQKYKTKEGEIVSGIVVKQVDGKNVYFDIGKAVGILPVEEQIRGEFYKPGNRLKLYVLKVENTPKGPVIFLSRAHPKLISKLFELESPEISVGTVVIKSIAREPGLRTKIAVESKVAAVDPIGAVVGHGGMKVQAVINELGGEKIDVIEWSENIEKYIINSLAPAKITEVKILPKNKALVVTPDDQLSLAIGKEGQNVRLAAKLVGWKIDVKPSSTAEVDIKEEEE